VRNLSKYLGAPEAFVDRTLSRYRVAPDGCWLYTGSVTRDGYAQTNYKLGGRQFSVYPHVLSFLRHNGELIPEQQVDHKCHDPATCIEPCQHRRCLNPSHLEAVTGRENVLRSGGLPAQNARKNRCPRGHEYDLIRADGVRRCSECEREKGRRNYERNGKAENAKRAKKMRTDPEYRERRLAQQRQRSTSEEAKAARRERYANDSEYREKVKARSNARAAMLRAEARTGG
jgi:hypothetical protein